MVSHGRSVFPLADCHRFRPLSLAFSMHLQPTIYERAGCRHLLLRVSPDQCVLAKSETSSLSVRGSAETFPPQGKPRTVRQDTFSVFVEKFLLSFRASPDQGAANHIMGDTNSCFTSLYYREGHSTSHHFFHQGFFHNRVVDSNISGTNVVSLLLGYRVRGIFSRSGPLQFWLRHVRFCSSLTLFHLVI